MPGSPSSTSPRRLFAIAARLFLLILLPLVAAQDVPKLPEAAGKPMRSDPCATMANTRSFFDLSPEFEVGNGRWQSTERLVNTWMLEARAAKVGVRTGPLVIPVVVHVVLKHPDPSLQVPLGVVQSQIDALNRDFGCQLDPLILAEAMCGDNVLPSACPEIAVAGAPCLHFALAQRDPDCHPTEGVTYTTTAHDPWVVVAEDNLDEGMKFTASGGKDAWPSDQYLNIWVVDIAAGGALGHATFPVVGADPLKDGLIIDWGVFGDLVAKPSLPPMNAGASPLEYRRGRVAVHETGHWLDLLHLWGPDWPASCTDSDLVPDTPVQTSQHTSCNLSPADDSCSAEPGADLCQDFMDYTDDEHRVLFSDGQVMRTLGTLFTQRASLLGSHGHIAPIAGTDLWMADAWDDVGTEPDPTAEPVWLSPDIWVRAQADGITHQEHQDPAFETGKQFVYVRVRNRGCESSAAAKLKLYWAKAGTGLAWPDPWNGSAPGPPPMGGPIDTRAIASLPGGSQTIEMFEWTPPDPRAYASFGDQAGHFCLLARIEADSPAPFGMTFPEGPDLHANVRNNNNIAWKNLWVSRDDLETKSYSMKMDNRTDEPQRAWLRLGGPWRRDLKALGDLGRFHVQLGGPLAPPGLDDVRRGAGRRAVGDDKLSLAGTGSLLGPFELAPRSSAVVRLEFQPTAGLQPLPGLYVLDLQQWTGRAGPERIVGGVTVAVDVGGGTRR